MHDQQLYMQVRLSAAGRFLTAPLKPATRRRIQRPVCSLPIHVGCQTVLSSAALRKLTTMLMARLAMH